MQKYQKHWANIYNQAKLQAQLYIYILIQRDQFYNWINKSMTKIQLDHLVGAFANWNHLGSLPTVWHTTVLGTYIQYVYLVMQSFKCALHDTVLLEVLHGISRHNNILGLKCHFLRCRSPITDSGFKIISPVKAKLQKYHVSECSILDPLGHV